MQVSASSLPICFGDVLWRNNLQAAEPASTTREYAGNLSDNINFVSDIVHRYDVQDITPRAMAKMSRELYDNGSISFKSHAFISFQPELNPSFNATIGKFSHTTAQPDSPRNFLDEWRERLAEQTRSGASPEIVNNTSEVVAILDNLAARRDNLVSQK
jgi:hypothetical protein